MEIPHNFSTSGIFSHEEIFNKLLYHKRTLKAQRINFKRPTVWAEYLVSVLDEKFVFPIITDNLYNNG